MCPWRGLELYEHTDRLMLRAEQVGNGLIAISCPE